MILWENIENQLYTNFIFPPMNTIYVVNISSVLIYMFLFVGLKLCCFSLECLFSCVYSPPKRVDLFDINILLTVSISISSFQSLKVFNKNKTTWHMQISHEIR